MILLLFDCFGARQLVWNAHSKPSSHLTVVQQLTRWDYHALCVLEIQHLTMCVSEQFLNLVAAATTMLLARPVKRTTLLTCA